MENKKIYLNQAGYEEYLAAIENLKEKINQSSQDNVAACETAVGDGWHDNFLFEESTRNERKLTKELSNMNHNLKRITILNDEPQNGVINFNDTFKLRFFVSPNDKEDGVFQLTGSIFPKSDSEITINSPLGQAIYHQPIGSKHTYKVNDNEITVEIIAIV